MCVGAFCIGTNQIDLAECETRGIAVFNAPYSNALGWADVAISHGEKAQDRCFGYVPQATKKVN